MNEAAGKASRVFVAGHRGLVGSAVVRHLQRAGFTNLLTRSREELDLTQQARVREFFSREKPDCVVLAAAKVGGILANDSYAAEFIHQNLAIQTHVIHEAWRSGVGRLVFLGSSCVYPRDCPQPIKEEYLLTGPLEKTNEAYAVAKIAGIKMCAAYNAQYGTEFVCAMPTNAYGIGDNYDLLTSHVLPALIRKAHEARTEGAERMVVWGTGNPRRELLFSEDLAEACALLICKDWKLVSAAFASPALPILNIGTGEDLSIRELAQIVAAAVGFRGAIAWDRSKPDGTPQKLLDVSRMNGLGWKAKTSLRDGISIAYDAFRSSVAQIS